MSDKEYFNFENGKMFKFADLRKKIRRDSFSDSQLKKVFNIFDTDSSGALEVSNSRGENELVSLWNRLKSAATRNNEGDDNVLDDSEIDFFVKNNLGVDTNVTVDQLKAFIQNIFSLKQESENTYTPLQIEYTEEDIKENAKNTISNNVSKGLELFYGQNENQGYVSDLVNDFKENFNTQMAASRINRWLLREEYSSMLINQADSDSGLTKRDYYMAKIDLLSKLLPEITHKKIAGKINGMMRLFSGNLIALAMQLGIDDIEGLSDEELQTLCEKELLYEALMRLPMDKINTLISTLCTIPDDEFASFESPEISTAIDEVVNFVTDNSHLTGEIPKEKIFTPAKGSVKELILQNSSSEKLSFEETFYEERKVPYNKAFVEDYAQKSSYLEYLVAVNNRVSEINEKLNKHLNAIKSETSNGMVYDSRAMYTMLNDVVNSVLNDIYNGDAEKIQEFLDSVFGKGKAKVSAESSADTCPIKIDVDGSAFSMQMLAEAIINKNNETLAKLLNGKSLEEYSTEVKEAYFFAYGNNNSVDFAEEYTKSQQEGVQNTKVVVQATGMVIMICGQLIPVVGQAGGALGGTAFATLGKVGVLGGTTLATFGSVGVSAVENVLKPGGVTQQDKKEMLQELTDSIMLFSSGVAGGKLAEGVFKAMVLKNCPKLIAFASEVGVDATCSLLSDLAITGQIDLSGEGIAQLQNILTGIILSKGNFKTYLNTHAGDLTPKGKTPQVTEIKNSQQNRNTNGSEIIFKETSDLIVKKLNSPSRDHISEESTNLQLAEFKKLFEKYPEIPQELIINLIDNPNIRMRVRNGSVDFNMFADILELTSRYPEHQIELLKLLKSDEYNYSNIKEALSNPKFIEIARIAGCKFALTNLKDGILDIGIDKYEQLNRVLYGKAASELSAIKENFETQNGITLHIDNNIDPHKASEYAKMLNEVIERYYVAGKEPPKEIYITNLVPENADGVAWARRYPDVIAVRPIDDIERFKHNVFHEAAHLTDMTMKIRDLQYQPIGTKLSVENGKLTRICDKAYGEELKKSITAYIGWYAATDTNEFTAEVGAMLFENKITVKQTEVNGEITTEVIINEPFINNDGVTIKITPEIRAEIEKIIDYYFEIGGQNFSHTPDNQSLSRRNVSLNQPADATDYRQTAVSGVVEEVAPFAKHLERTPDIQDLTNPEIKKIVLENGEFDENGDFISDGTYTVTESGKPGAKSVTYKRYPDGDRRIAQNMDELFEQVLKLRDIKELSQSEKWQIEAFVNAHPELSIAEISELAQDYNHILGNISNLFDTDYSYIKNIPDLRILKANISEFDKFSFKYRNVPGYSIVDIRTFFDNMSEINPEDYKFVLNNLEEGNLRVLHRVDKENVEFTKLILKDKDIPREHIRSILGNTNADKLKFAEELVTKYKDFPREYIARVLESTNADNLKFAEVLVQDKDIPVEHIVRILGFTNTYTEYRNLAKFLVTKYKNIDIPQGHIMNILRNTNSGNQKILKDLLTKYKDIPRGDISGILAFTYDGNIEFAEELMTKYTNIPREYVFVLLYCSINNPKLATNLAKEYNGNNRELLIKAFGDIDNDCLDLAEDLVTKHKDIPREYIAGILQSTNKDNLKFAKDIVTKYKDFTKEYIDRVYQEAYEFNRVLFPTEYIPKLLRRTNVDNLKFAEDLVTTYKDIPRMYIAGILQSTNKDNLKFAEELVTKYKDFPREKIAEVLQYTNAGNLKFAEELVTKYKDFPRERIAEVLQYTNAGNLKLAEELVKDKDIPREHIAQILEYTNADNLKFAEELVTTKDIPREHILSILQATNDEIKQDFARNLCKNYKQMEIPADKILFLINNYGNISPKDLQKLNHVMGRDKVAKLSNSDMLIACQMVDVCGKTSINEIPMEGRQTFLRKLVGCNTGLFTVSDEVKKAFPLIPTDRETYCSLLPSIVKSLGVDIRTIEPPSRIKEFNTNLESLSSSVAKLSDRDFANMEITLDYPKNEFIKNVLNIVKDLNPQERQKVYDYFGFELHENKNNPTGFSIIGYPINLNNGKKLAEITDPKTKSVVENLRPEVIKFSEQNRVKCNNPDVQKLLNDIVDVLPELRTQIGKVQHKTHDYDVFKHSLKVMQKITQDPKFQTLNESDKKLMMLASLLHDITKGEGYSDKTHAAQGSFDTFFIAKKFNLTREEEIKLYTLTRHHEWLEYVNTAKSETELTKRLQSVAYDLQHDNLFDMALMFTHADLRAVKSDDTFHDTKVGASRVDFNGNVRSFGEAADVYAQRIRNYIKELQKSQPLLPVTKIPKSDRINSAITKVNPDGSTNIKGVYKRSDGLVVIKFNEVDDWEAIGFPKGSVSKGYMAQAGSKASDGSFAENVNTGNIKFFVHGLDYENQLAKFDAFSLIDSDVLLSVSYAERPESKYRFFRAQGVLLDFDTKYIHGGGNTDSGSGCGKFIEDFKKDYIFGGYREFDRVYVSNLIKNATGMSDEDYVKFVEKNKNRALTEIEPAAYREPIIKALAAINSNTRKGGRSYNEMYGSNPKEVMGVFAYDTSVPSNVDNPLDFLLRRQDTEFLQKYAIEHNLPFVVFGD